MLQYSGTKAAIEALNANWVFWAIVGALALLFINCLRQLWMVYIIRTEHKYQAVDEMAKMVDNADMFRAQRNVYISGLAFA